MSKHLAYADLVDQRRRCRLCLDLVNPSTVNAGQLDADEIGPWSRWQGNLDAPLMVVGQDWGDVRYFEIDRGLDGAKNPTNDMLRELLGSIGIEIAPPGDSALPQRVFFTNAILCLKTEGGLQGAVRPSWFSNCGTTFLRPLIGIVHPKVVACLGRTRLDRRDKSIRPTARPLRRTLSDDVRALAVLTPRCAS